MPISPYIGIVPGSIGSFPQAGVRPKQTKYAIFSSSGVWVCPPNVFSVNFTMCGGGGGGGAGDGGSNGGGGGAGAMTINDCPITVIPGTTYTITVGANGTGATAGNNNATMGGASSIVGGLINLFVSGGRAGIVGGAATAVAAATVPTQFVGAVTTLLSNLQVVAGGQGATTNQNGGNSGFSFGGFANPNSLANGGGGGASFLGNGGNGGVAVGGTPTGYGGGGGGGSSTNNGGNGAPGVCQLVWLEGI